VLAGGADQDHADALPLLKPWGGEVQHLGPVGTGNAAKLVRNLTLGLAVTGVGEALRLGVRLGSNPGPDMNKSRRLPLAREPGRPGCCPDRDSPALIVAAGKIQK
jgi:hypothetical protein